MRVRSQTKSHKWLTISKMDTNYIFTWSPPSCQNRNHRDRLVLPVRSIRGCVGFCQVVPCVLIKRMADCTWEYAHDSLKMNRRTQENAFIATSLDCKDAGLNEGCWENRKLIQKTKPYDRFRYSLARRPAK